MTKKKEKKTIIENKIHNYFRVKLNHIVTVAVVKY